MEISESNEKKGCGAGCRNVVKWTAIGVASIVGIFFVIAIVAGLIRGVGESTGLLPTRTPTLTPTITPTPTNTPVPTSTPTADEIKAGAVTIPFKELARNTEIHVGKLLYYTAKVIQVAEGSNNQYVIRANVTKGEYDIWSDTIWLNYQSSELRLLEDDIIDVWAIVDGRRTYQSVLGGEITLPELTPIIVELRE